MLKIHGVPISVHTRKVIVTCIEKQLKFENDPVIPFNPPANWAALSPTGKIPAMTDGDFTLADSAAICAYLERSHPQHPVFPKDAKDYARALWFEQYAGALFHDVIHGLFFQKIIRPNILKQPTDTDVIDRILLEPMPKMFGYLERQVRGEYLVGDSFGIGDIALTSNLINYHYLGFAIDTNRFPVLAAYFAKQIRRPSFAKALAAEQPFASGMGLDRGFATGLEAAA
jgi:glutathione S-transferase